MRKYEELIKRTEQMLKQKKDSARKQDVLGLLAALTRCGFRDEIDGYDLWAETWIYPKLFKLIPDLKKAKEELDLINPKSEGVQDE